MAVRRADTDVGEKRHAASITSTTSTLPSTLRTHWPLRSRGREVGILEAPTKEDVPETYDVAVLIVMPTSHPRVVDHLDKLGEYAIGTLKLAATTSPRDPIHREPLRSISILSRGHA
jgi:hypothetical protein